MKLVRVIDIDGELYGEPEIKEMYNDQLKMIISFVETEKELRWIQKWCENNFVIESYIDNLINECFPIKSI